MPFTFQFGGPNAFGGGFNPENFQGGTPNPRPRKARKPRRAMGNAFTRTLINLAVTLVFGLVYFYLELPALNLHAEEFYVFAFLLCAVYCGCAVFTSGFQTDGGVKGYFHFVRKQCAIPFLAVVVLIIALALGALSSWVVLRAGSYSKLLSIQAGDFTAEVEGFPCWTRIPPPVWAPGSWASWRTWCPSSRFSPLTPRSTTRAARCG